MDFSGRTYTYANGRRKTSVAQVRLYEQGTGQVIVNGKELKEAIRDKYLFDVILFPLKLAGALKKFDFSIRVVGGGKSGQADACRFGIARAMFNLDEALKPMLKAEGLLSRDSRIVERKKPGKKKARRSSQWAKR